MRGLSTREGDHGRGTYLMRTGYVEAPEVQYPTLGSLVSKELAPDELGDDLPALPSFISVNPHFDFSAAAYDSGFLGPGHASLNVKSQIDATGGALRFGVDNLAVPASVSPRSSAARREILADLQARSVAARPRSAAATHDAMLRRALSLMNSDAGRAFDLSSEAEEVRTKYGPSSFGQGCLLARRLIETGVSFVEVSLGDFGRWDTHNQNFPSVQQLSAELDAGWASLIEDLADRGLLESTTMLWMGEFGRTPQINASAGRDHYPAAWSAVLAGGGIAGGQAYGRTGADGMEVTDGRIDQGDLLATLCAALGIDPRKQNISDIGRPFKIAEGQPVAAVLEG
jgi:uncharacterized protein (DUF1501 family)